MIEMRGHFGAVTGSPGDEQQRGKTSSYFFFWFKSTTISNNYHSLDIENSSVVVVHISISKGSQS